MNCKSFIAVGTSMVLGWKNSLSLRASILPMTLQTLASISVAVSVPYSSSMPRK